MNKLEMAHDWAMKRLNDRDYVVSMDQFVSDAWQYADAMQAEDNKRIDKSLPDVLQNNLLNKDLYEIKESIKNRTSAPYWSPDWSVAPDWANWWTMDADSQAHFTKRQPLIEGDQWVYYSAAGQKSQHTTAPTFNYNGNWQDSLRKRPDGAEK